MLKNYTVTIADKYHVDSPEEIDVVARNAAEAVKAIRNKMVIDGACTYKGLADYHFTARRAS